MNAAYILVGFLGGTFFFTGFMGLWQLAAQPNPDGCYMLPLAAEKWLPPYTLLSNGGQCLPKYFAADTAGLVLFMAFLIVIIGVWWGREQEI